MLTLAFKRIIVSAMALLALLTANTKTEFADSCAAYDFPRIVAEEQAPGTLRIMSFNIRCGDVNGVQIKERREIMLRQIREIMPDSLGVQESTAEWMQTLCFLLPEYGWVGVERENGGWPLSSGESCPIFYLKSKFLALKWGNFWLSETPDKPSFGPGDGCKRICTWVLLLDRQTGQRIVHVNTHFENRSEDARLLGADVVKRFVAERFPGVPVVFTADMNESEKGAAYASMTQVFTDTRFAAKDSVFYGTYHGGRDLASRENGCIDFVLCTDQFAVEAYRTVTAGVDNRYTSDHFPIYADLKLPLSCPFGAAAN